LALAEQRLKRFCGQVNFFHCRFSDFCGALDELGWEKIDGALIDIGISSMQLDSAERGFSFLHEGPLDMRMDRDGGEKAAQDFINRASMTDMRNIIARYGEDPQAARIARAIANAREKAPITTTTRLAEIISGAYPARWRAAARNHPATRTFQALRMAVNNELEELAGFMERIVDRLSVGGRLAVITFHSLEDRMVKHRLRDLAQECVCPRHVPRCVCGHKAKVRALTKKPIIPQPGEIKANPRAASAKLRAAERLPA
jgi:16S rRNA (cytosine1402-N4)-methyltransferase